MAAPTLPIDSVLFQTASVRVGAFRCGVRDPHFRDSGPAEGHIVVFPRVPVWIRHAGAAPFLADAGVVTIYNRGQEYTRGAVAPEGDRSDWFGVSAEVAWTMAQAANPRTANPDRPYAVRFVGSDARLYLKQRLLFHRLRRGGVDPLAVEEQVLHLVAEVIRKAQGAAAPGGSTRPSHDAHRALVEGARTDLVAHLADRTDVTAMAERLGVSPFHLCRVFRSHTGMTLHQYRVDLRLRAALDALGDGSRDLSRLACELGFASHSHFTATMRKHLGETPTSLRRRLASLPAPPAAGSLRFPAA